ncbi:MAG TPA: hypothetical protein VF092_12815 [Longimicrobium sp.]
MGLFDFLRKRGGDDRAAATPAPGELPTPLSELMARVMEDGSDASWRAFGEAFLRSRVGVVASDVPAPGEDPPRGRPIAPMPPGGGSYVVPAGRAGLGKAATPDGRVMILACADRDAFVRKFHARFNREVMGRDLAQVALAIPDCEGILLNSAASLHSIALDRTRLTSLLEQRP